MTGERPEVQKPWTMAVSEVLETADVSREDGLTADEVERRLEQFGPNELRDIKRRG